MRGDTTLVAWLEWQEDLGDQLIAEVAELSSVVGEGPEDLFRPTAAVASDGTPWLVFGRCVDAVVGVWASRFVGGGWTEPEPVSTTEGPSSNHEVVASDDGSLHVCWQGRAGDGFAIFPTMERHRLGFRRSG